MTKFVPWPPECPRPPALPDWADDYLDYYALHGLQELACNHARIHRATVQRLRHADQAFDDACTRARDYFRDSLQWRLVEQSDRVGHPLGFFGRLKVELPELYLDRQLLMNLDLKADLSSEDATSLLQNILGKTTPTTQALLGLPPHPDPQGS